MMQSTRSKMIMKRTYARGNEEWEDIVNRSINHQRWLWSRVGVPDEKELEILRQIHLNFEGCVSGRVLWMADTQKVKEREASCFNCSFVDIYNSSRICQSFWLLLNGCGVGFSLGSGTTAYKSRLYVTKLPEIKPSLNKDKGYPKTTFINNTLMVGDSAEGWVNALHYILNEDYIKCIDFSEVRKTGTLLEGYGWQSSGYEPLCKTFVEILKVRQTSDNLSILDIMNWLGTCLSSRRSAEIACVENTFPHLDEFMKAKPYGYTNYHRTSSNNTVIYREKPDILKHLYIMDDCGGGDPGIANLQECLSRAPWFAGFNPCVEVLLADCGFCNLTTINVTKGNVLDTMYYIARANYRQTCVNLKDGILEDTWHDKNEFLRLCGVSLTGLAQIKVTNRFLNDCRRAAYNGAMSMAREFQLEMPKNITLIKPEGTIAKVFDCTEGNNRPQAKYMINNVVFPNTNPQLGELDKLGYKIIQHPTDSTCVLVSIPIPVMPGVEFTNVNGLEIDTESAVSQLNRYIQLQQHYVDQNTSSTISYRREEIPQIAEWLDRNWNNGFVSVAFLRRPEKLNDTLGYQYLPQEIVSKEEYFRYNESLKDVTISSTLHEDDTSCAGGNCPLK